MSYRGLLVALLLTAAPASGAELRTLKGESIAGEIVSITDKEIVVLRGGERVSTPLTQVLQIDYLPAGTLPAEPFIDVELTDGSLLHCASYSIKGKEIELSLAAGPKVHLPLSAVDNILTDANVEKDRKEWSDRLADRKAKKKRRDVLAVRKQGVLNALEGTLGDGDDKGETISFAIGSGKTRAVPLAGVAGMIFERGVNPGAAPVVCKVTDTSRDRIEASDVASSAIGLVVTTPCGAKFELAPALVVRLDYSGGKLTWLSDLQPTEVVERYIDSNTFHYKRDHNIDDGPIRLDSITYARGLSLHATTELEYDLKGDYREFKTVAGIDDQLSGGQSGSTVLRIEGDGKLLQELTFDPRDKVRHREIALNIKDVQKLRIRVAPGGEGLRLYFGLHLDLADAKVSK
jgi:NPCBM/NEW2 domain